MSKQPSRPHSLREVYNEVAFRTIAHGNEFSVSETACVLACFFDVLEELNASDACFLIAKGMQQAAHRRN